MTGQKESQGKGQDPLWGQHRGDDGMGGGAQRDMPGSWAGLTYGVAGAAWTQDLDFN